MWFGQQSEDPRHGSEFGRFALRPSLFGVNDRVAGVDLTNVMDEKHADDAIDIDRRAGILRHRRSQQRNLPTVLGRILITLETERPSLARDTFELFQFQDEIDDLLHDGC